jgi:predicted transcriptional regulator
MELLSGTEWKILDVASKLAAASKLITTESLYRLAKQSLADSKEEISAAIYDLVIKKYIVIGSKITKNQVLLNEKRFRIHEYISQNPGCHLNEIKAFINLKGQLVKWHLAILEKFDFVFSVTYLKYLAFFPKEFDRTLIVPYLTLKNANANAIFSTLWANPGLTLSDLRPLISLDLPTLKYHLQKLVESKVIEIQEVNQHSHYFLNSEILKILQKSLNISDDELENLFNYQKEFKEILLHVSL